MKLVRRLRWSGRTLPRWINEFWTPGPPKEISIVDTRYPTKEVESEKATRPALTMKRLMKLVILGPEVSRRTPRRSGLMKFTKEPPLKIVETWEGVIPQPSEDVKRVDERDAQPKKRPPARKFWRTARRM
mmetsp:Transcript_8087/g.14642  ORF Transcript_8087/g.14642 Transcript_8087/m.14642 type:complete len:130 (+) Transcript_8087:1182-1571(+)